MNPLLSRLFGNSKASLPRGYSYAPDSKPAQFAEARPGLTIGTFKDEPPWIVVDHSLSSIVIPSWPGKLWEVQVLKLAPEQPRAGAGYVRATAVRIEEEVPPALLFGKNGVAVVEIFDRAQRLTVEQRDCLANHHVPSTDQAFSKAWNRWLSKVDPASPHQGEDHRDTLAITSAGARSPVGSAFTVLHSVVSQRARKLEGDAAFIVENDEVSFAPSWALAFSALLHACMAVGTDADLLSEGERHDLLSGYSTLN